MTTSCFVATRAVHFAACLLLFGLFAFDRLAVSAIFREHAEITAGWRKLLRSLAGILVPIIFLSGLAWFALVAANMSGTPLPQSFQPEIWRTVWSKTSFGIVWQFRLIFWLIAALATMVFIFCRGSLSLENCLIWLDLLPGCLLLGSLAWAGHGQEGSVWHLCADVLHLLVAGIWPTGLLPMCLLLRKLQQPAAASHLPFIAVLVRRFSALSLGSVALLVITGWVNGWYLVGSFSNLFHDPYGHWLLAKVLLFCLAVCLGAANLVRFKPRILHAVQTKDRLAGNVATRKLRHNVQLELAVGSAIVLVVAVLGLLPPTAH